MATRITFSAGDRDYCLEYTKRTVKMMEDRGFAPEKIVESPMTYLPELFAGAFLANHRFVKREVINELYESMEDKQELVSTLIEMYNEPIKALTSDSEEGNAIKWTKEQVNQVHADIQKHLKNAVRSTYQLE